MFSGYPTKSSINNQTNSFKGLYTAHALCSLVACTYIIANVTFKGLNYRIDDDHSKYKGKGNCCDVTTLKLI